MPGLYCGSSVESKKTHAPDFKPALKFLPFSGRVQPGSTSVSLQISANAPANFSCRTEITGHKHAAGQGGLDQGCAMPPGTSIAPGTSWAEAPLALHPRVECSASLPSAKRTPGTGMLWHLLWKSKLVDAVGCSSMAQTYHIVGHLCNIF